jgi:hypothetical protein
VTSRRTGRAFPTRAATRAYSETLRIIREGTPSASRPELIQSPEHCSQLTEPTDLQTQIFEDCGIPMPPKMDGLEPAITR